jgi:hypothetical protein
MVAGDPQTWRPIVLAYEGTPAVVRARIDRDRDIVRGRIEAVAEQVLAAGVGTPGVDAGVVAHALVAVGEYYGRRLLEAPETVDVDTLASTVGGLLAAARA